jgi:hypothetical protein
VQVLFRRAVGRRLGAARMTCGTWRRRCGAKLRRPATEVARRAGHGVAVMPKIYAHCIDGHAAANQRIADALGTQDAGQDPGDEADDDSGLVS